VGEKKKPKGSKRNQIEKNKDEKKSNENKEKIKKRKVLAKVETLGSLQVRALFVSVLYPLQSALSCQE